MCSRRTGEACAAIALAGRRSSLLAQLPRRLAIRLVGAVGRIERRVDAGAGLDVAALRWRVGPGADRLLRHGLRLARLRRADFAQSPLARVGLIGAVRRAERTVPAGAGMRIAQAGSGLIGRR